MKRVTCFPEQPLGKLRPQHGICNWPQPLSCYDNGSDLPQYQQIMEMFRQIDPPATRMKYTYSAYGKAIDVPFIFRDFRKDGDDPANYYFYQTDPIVERTVAAGKPIIYHLGTVRENWSVFYTRKPADYEKYATVCLNIIRHLNDGWADGLHSGIEYWEIWNRADDPHCWADGTAEDYYRLYEAVAKKIKAAYPQLKVGGPAAADVSDPAFLQGFLDYVTANAVPCDFVSWHYYGTDAAEAGRLAKQVKTMVKDAGLDVPVVNDEWNAIVLDEQGIVQCPDTRHIKGAAFDAAFMMQMEEAGMEFCTYYDATCGKPWSGLYESAGYKANKPIYAFLAFSRLYDLENRVAVKTAGNNVYAMAAQKDGQFALLAAVCQDQRDKLELNLPAGKKRIRLLDDNHDLAVIAETEENQITLSLHGHSVLLVESI